MCRNIKIGIFEEYIEFSNVFKGWFGEIIFSLEYFWNYYIIIIVYIGIYLLIHFVNLFNGWFGLFFGFKYVVWILGDNGKVKRDKIKVRKIIENGSFSWDFVCWYNFVW